MAVVCNIKMNHSVPVYKLTLCSFVFRKKTREKEKNKVQKDMLKYAR